MDKHVEVQLLKLYEQFLVDVDAQNTEILCNCVSYFCKTTKCKKYGIITIPLKKEPVNINQ